MIVWRLARPLLAVSSAPLGGGLGLRSWVVNAEVAADYARRDPDRHLEELSASAGLSGAGVGMLTAASIDELSSAAEEGVEVHATVGIEHPTWAAADGSFPEKRPGRHDQRRRVRARATLRGGTGERRRDPDRGEEPGACSTPACRARAPRATLSASSPRPMGSPQRFCGPRSFWGARLARAAYRAVSAGCAGTVAAKSPRAGIQADRFARRPGTTAS